MLQNTTQQQHKQIFYWNEIQKHIQLHSLADKQHLIKQELTGKHTGPVVKNFLNAKIKTILIRQTQAGVQKHSNTDIQ